MDAMKSNYKETTKELGEIVNEQDKANKWLKEWDNKLQKIKVRLVIKLKEKEKQLLFYNQHQKV